MNKNPLESLHMTLALGFGLAVVAFLILHVSQVGDLAFWQFVFRWLHVFFGILWIGLLYYFNFVQIPTVPKIDEPLRPAISRFIAPAALFFFRWAAAATVLFGVITALFNYELLAGLFFLDGVHGTIGIGMWLALIMAANVWFIIWPNQKKVLGIVTADAVLASRTNTMLSIPMLYCMVGQQNLGSPF
jgi:uncharacterized membrane protein